MATVSGRQARDQQAAQGCGHHLRSRAGVGRPAWGAASSRGAAQACPLFWTKPAQRAAALGAWSHARLRAGRSPPARRCCRLCWPGAAPGLRAGAGCVRSHLAVMQGVPPQVSADAGRARSRPARCCGTAESTPAAGRPAQAQARRPERRPVRPAVLPGRGGQAAVHAPAPHRPIPQVHCGGQAWQPGARAALNRLGCLSGTEQTGLAA